jgi:DNA-binding Xre family transcriptional regulator
MENIYKNIEKMCKTRGENITEMCKNAGIPRSIMTELKMGRAKTLSYATMDKLAKYFCVSINYIANGEDDGIKDQNDGIDDFGFAMYNYGKKLTEEQKQILIDLAKSMNTKE